MIECPTDSASSGIHNFVSWDVYCGVDNVSVNDSINLNCCCSICCIDKSFFFYTFVQVPEFKITSLSLNLCHFYKQRKYVNKTEKRWPRGCTTKQLGLLTTGMTS